MGQRHHRNQRGGTSGPVRHGPQATRVVPGLGADVPELRQARALWQRNRFDESLRLFEAAVMIFRPEKAMDCFERVLAVTKEIPDAFLELAILYERRHRVEAAHSLIEDCLNAAPDYLEAELFKARLLRRVHAEPESERVLRELTDNTQAHPLVRAQAWAELAQAHDRREEYADAMSSILKCKELLRPYAPAARRESEVVLRQLWQSPWTQSKRTVISHHSPAESV